MGLDMYAFAAATKLTTPVDFAEPPDAVEFHYWRKHPNLHGWMQRLYEARGGGNADFNCSPLVLDMDDLDALKATIRHHRLPETSGFFFGVSLDGEEKGDLAFVAKARALIRDGKTVLYYAW
jgi:hypothetical protein